MRAYPCTNPARDGAHSIKPLTYRLNKFWCAPCTATHRYGVSGLCVTKLDVMDGMESVRIDVGYRINGVGQRYPAGGCGCLGRLPCGVRRNAGLERRHGGSEALRISTASRAQLLGTYCASLRCAGGYGFDRTGSRRNHRAASSVRISCTNNASTNADCQAAVCVFNAWVVLLMPRRSH